MMKLSVDTIDAAKDLKNAFNQFMDLLIQDLEAEDEECVDDDSNVLDFPFF